jgi:hypothetical protein
MFSTDSQREQEIAGVFMKIAARNFNLDIYDGIQLEKEEMHGNDFYHCNFN